MRLFKLSVRWYQANIDLKKLFDQVKQSKNENSMDLLYMTLLADVRRIELDCSQLETKIAEQTVKEQRYLSISYCSLISEHNAKEQKYLSHFILD